MTGDPSGRPSHTTSQSPSPSAHDIVREHVDYMRSIADNAQQEVPLRLRNELDAVPQLPPERPDGAYAE